jgi:hypothetical protein
MVPLVEIVESALDCSVMTATTALVNVVTGAALVVVTLGL